MNQNLKFQIQDLRKQSVVEILEAMMMLLGALFVTALLPSLLLRYFYADAQLFEQPKTLEYIPVAAFVVGIFYLLKAYFNNLRRNAQIRKLQMELGADGSCCGTCTDCATDDKAVAESKDETEEEDWEKELAELEALLDEEEKEAPKKAIKKTSKKSTKKKSK